ncbi:MAG: hypothetical protein IPL53_14180 [Ignavibacteria bacterium]|nr:hypothetical protein [Ignavibacteria bacterium]
MKTTKLYTGILLMICLAVITSCSDSITSSLNSASNENQVLNSGNIRKSDSYSATFLLNSGESIRLHSGLTGLEHITEYSISNCGITKKDLYITASNIDASQSLPCGSSNYFLEDLLIENRSEHTRSIDVKLIGAGK